MFVGESQAGCPVSGPCALSAHGSSAWPTGPSLTLPQSSLLHHVVPRSAPAYQIHPQEQGFHMGLSPSNSCSHPCTLVSPSCHFSTPWSPGRTFSATYLPIAKWHVSSTGQAMAVLAKSFPEVEPTEKACCGLYLSALSKLAWGVALIQVSLLSLRVNAKHT